MVAVVQTDQFRRDDPDWSGKDEQQRRSGAASPEPDDDGGRGDREHVAEGEHPPQERLWTVRPRSTVGNEAFPRGAGRCTGGDVDLTQSGGLHWYNGRTRPKGRTHRSFGSRRPPLKGS